MSTLQRLQVRGIRNFGVDAEDEQKITFTAPLSLILGQNGSGKTTIIECIKYALTGELPPNCKNGIGFINNPEIQNHTESTGQVKLRIKNLQGTEITISRSAKVMKKAQKAQFKSLDTTITVDEKDREPISISKRSADATDEITCAVGVSKAIINHVLFCHQEEASWPLGTDQEVMSKFDQIFGTTEYNNALDKMRAMRKKYEAIIKDKRVNLKEMEMIKSEADKMNMEINKHEDEMQEMKVKLECCKKDLKPMYDEYNRVHEIGEQLSTITASKTKVETEYKNEQENARKLSAQIKTVFQGSETELEEEIRTFKERQLRKNYELAESEVTLGTATYELDQIVKRHGENDRKYHLLIQDRQREQDLCDEKAQFIRNLCANLNINADFDIQNDNNRSAALVQTIRTKLNEEQNGIKEIANENEKVDAEQEQEIRTHREQEVRIKSEITSTIKQMKELEETLAAQQAEIKKIETSGKILTEVQTNVKKIQAVHDQLLQQKNTQNTQNDIDKFRTEKRQLSDELEGIDEQITVLSSMATILAEVTSKEKQIEKRESDFRRIKNKHFQNLQRLFPGETIESGYKRSTENLGIKLQTEVSRFEAEVRLKEGQIQTFKAQLQSKKREHTNMEDELRRMQNDIDRVCEQTPFVDILATTKENVAKHQMELSSYKSSEVFYKKYIKEMEDQPCCPLCHNDLNRNDITNLTDELTDKIEMLPANITNSEQALRNESIKLERLYAVQGSVERVENLKSTLIPRVLEEIKDLETKLTAAQEKSKQSQRLVEEPREKKAIVDTMIPDMALLDEAIRGIEQTRIELEPLKQELTATSGQSDNNMEDLQKKRKDLTDRIKSLEKDIEIKDKRHQDDIKKFGQIQEKLIELKQKELTLKADIQKSVELKAREKELIEKINELKEKQAASDQALIPIEGRIKMAEDKRRRTKASGAEKYSAAVKRYDGFKKSFDSIERVSRELEKLATLNLEKEIERYNTMLVQSRKQQATQTNEIEAIREQIKSLTKEIAEQKNDERDLIDNLSLKKHQKKIEEKKKELETLQKHEQEVDFEQIVDKKAKLARDIEKIKMESQKTEGEMGEKKKSIEKLRMQTNEPKYRDSLRNYKMACYESIVLTKTVEDLNTYCETLERALTKFHSDKMEKINTLIRDLWRNIYKGNDIDFIQINTEEVKGTSRRRSYTYRVVASKNDTLMDFRGQSSAGQRVLACLIIRIALAETFSGHCGVLALDEPTTNLDKINIESLCEALNRIVEEREGQRNFMLIVITHDEDFINSLGRVMSYTRVSRDENGKSRLQKLRVQ